jgi:hypothetical protein
MYHPYVYMYINHYVFLEININKQFALKSRSCESQFTYKSMNRFEDKIADRAARNKVHKLLNTSQEHVGT